MRVDLHLHTSEYSECGKSPAREMCEAAADLGLEGLVFTNHDKYVPEAHMADLRREFTNLDIFNGIEVGVGGEHVVIIGAHDERLASKSLDWPQIHGLVRELGGAMILAHPFRYKPEVGLDLDVCAPDCVEVHSMNTGACDEAAIERLAASCGARIITTSDGHIVDNVGAYHVELTSRPHTEAELVALIREGYYEPRSRPDRIAEHNAGILERERVVRKMISEGRTNLEYQDVTGLWHGFYDRVAQGKSYCI